MRKCFRPALVVVCALTMFSSQCSAQRRGKMMQGGGGQGGAGMMQGAGMQGSNGQGRGGQGPNGQGLGMMQGRGMQQNSGCMQDGQSGSFGGNMMGQGMSGRSMMNNQNQMNSADGMGCGGFGNGTAAGLGENSQSVNARPTPARFAQAAMRFDANADRQLDQVELVQVAAAVIAELQNHAAAAGRQSQNPSILTDASSERKSHQRMATAFVAKALTFDRDSNGSLNQTETRILATAFLKSMN